MSLAEELRNATSTVHAEAEGCGFMRCFVRGTVDRETYIAYLENLRVVYGALEAALEESSDHPVVAPIYFPQLHRSAAIRQDLDFLRAETTSSDDAECLVGAAARAYAQHLAALNKDRPELLVAHSYVRYLGDLSGGQVLKHIAARNLGLAADSGLSFYEFPMVEDHREFKDLYRTRLNELPVNDEQRRTVAAEAVQAFRLNLALFHHVEGILIEHVGWSRFHEAVAAVGRR